MLHMKVDFANFWQIKVACFTWRFMLYFLSALRLHALNTMSMFVSHIGCFGYECLEMKLCMSKKVDFSFLA